MTQQIIITSPTNSGDGTPLATAFDYCNNNFSQLYSRAQPTPPSTLIGSIGDQAGMYAYNSSYFYYCFANYNGNTAIWAQLEQAGNITATQILNGTSSVSIPFNDSNITVNVNGVSNVAVFNTLGVSVKGIVSATGNVRGANINTSGIVSAAGNITGNYILGNGSQLTGLPETYTNSNVVSLLASYGSNTISTTGNITAGYLLGNGSQLTGLPQVYGNSNVVSLLANFGENPFVTDGVINSSNNIVANGIIFATTQLGTQGIISATGNIYTSGYIIGDVIGNVIATLANIPGPAGAIVYNNGAGNAAATAGLVFDPTGPNLLTVLGTISSQGNIVGVNVRTAGLVSATGNITGGNILTGGQVSATGNITGNYILGNGSQLTGLPQSYTNSNVVSLMASFGSNVISTTGTITSGNINGSNLTTGGIISATSNITGGNLLTGGVISATSNIAGGNLLTSGQVSATGNINGNYIRAISDVIVGGNISITNLTGNAVSVIGNVTGSYILGNGRFLTGVIASANTSVVNGTSNVNIGTPNGNATISINGTPNVVVVSTLGISTSGNVSTGNINVNSDSITSPNTITIGNLNTSTTTVIVTGNLQANSSLTTNGFLINVANSAINPSGADGSGLGVGPKGSEYATWTYNSVSNAWNSSVPVIVANILVANITAINVASGNISATSNVVSGNINVTNNINSATISATSNVVSGNINVTNNINSATISATGNVVGANISATGNVIGGNLSVGSGTVTLNNIINGGVSGTGNIGDITTPFNTVFATATTALYADLAECYLADDTYAPGTVLSFGGSNEVTMSTVDADPLIAGVVSTNPAYKMNSGLTGDHVVAVALTGRIPCQVIGPVTRGAMMVSAGNGRARAESNPAMGTVIGKALESFGDGTGTIEIVVGRL